MLRNFCRCLAASDGGGAWGLGTVIPIGWYCPTNNTIQANPYPYKSQGSGYPVHTIRKCQKLARQNTFEILLLNDANMIGEH